MLEIWKPCRLAIFITRDRVYKEGYELKLEPRWEGRLRLVSSSFGFSVTLLENIIPNLVEFLKLLSRSLPEKWKKRNQTLVSLKKLILLKAVSDLLWVSYLLTI
jgi:hypothetical protein